MPAPASTSGRRFGRELTDARPSGADRAPGRAGLADGGTGVARAALAPGLVVFAGVPVLGAMGGGFATATWYPAALFALALLAVSLTLAPPAPPATSRAWRYALACYAAFCAWSLLSILWADVRGDAWEGANRSLLYGLVLMLVGLRPWPERSALVALGIVAFGTGAVALGVLVASAVGDPATLLLDGRLAAPTGYANATAAFWLIAFWPALHIASQAATALPWPLRALALATAALLLEIALLSQSRGALAGFAVAAVSYLWLAPHRGRAALALGALFALAAAAWAPLIGVRAAITAPGVAGAVAEARTAIALTVIAAFAAGAAGAVLEARLRPAGGRRRAGAGRLARRASWAARRAAPLALLAILAAVAGLGHPARWTADRWQDFKSSGYSAVETGDTRFTGSLGSNRYDFYRVALNEFRAHAVLGIGADNFAVPYLVDRRSDEAPRHPHSLAFRLLAQLGVPGTTLFALFLACALACARRCRRMAPASAGAVAAAVAGFAMWLAHGMVDWLWEFPALSIAALALLALAARSEAGEAPPPRRMAAPLWLRGGVALGMLGAATSFALPGLAARSIAAARTSAAADPALAVAQLQRAGELNVLAARPLVAQAVIARRAGLDGVARAALRRALEREPRNWFAHLQLALLEAEHGRRGRALRSLAAAAALNPRQPLLSELRDRVRRNDPVDATAVESRLSRQLTSKLGAVADDAARRR